MANIVTLGYEYFPDPTQGRPVSNGSIYVGVPDGDPANVPGDRKTISIVQEDGAVVPVSQPVLTSAGGVPIYNGSSVRIQADGLYSLAVLNNLGVQVYYLSKSSGSESIQYNQGSPGSVDRTVESKLKESASVKDFGGVGDGLTNDTAALNAFFASGGDLVLTDGVYLFDELLMDVDCNVSGNGVLRYSGAAPTSGTSAITGSGVVKFDRLEITSAGIGDVAFNLVELTADGVNINLLSMKADAERATTGGAVFFGSNVSIGSVVSRNIARPLEFRPVVAATIRTAITVGDVDIQQYIRGVKFEHVNFFKCGDIRARGRWTGATAIAGYNAVLTEVCSNYEFGDINVENSPEHSVRIGGAGGSSNFRYGNIFAKDSGGCAFKSNPDATFTTSNGYVASVTAVNNGEGSGLGNKEVVRLSKTFGVTIDTISAYDGCTRVLALAEVSDITVGDIYGEGVLARVVGCVDGQDGATGSINGVFIGNISARMDSGARSAYDINYANGLSEFYIYNSYVTGYSNFLANSLGAVITGDVLISARVDSTDPSPSIENVIDTDFLLLDVNQGLNAYRGRAVNIDMTSKQCYSDVSSFDPSGSATTKGTVFINSNKVAPSLGAYGGSFAFSRLGSNRRGAAISSKQITADSKEVGLAFFVGDPSTTGTELLNERMVLKHNGVLQLVALPTSAAGLTAGDLWNNSGVINIV